MQISQFFVNGDIKGAIAYMRDHEEFKDILPAYVAIFEDQKYRTYEIPDNLNDILRLYQIYFRNTFLLRLTGGGGRRQTADRAESTSKYTGCRRRTPDRAASIDVWVGGLSCSFRKNAGILRPLCLAEYGSNYLPR